LDKKRKKGGIVLRLALKERKEELGATLSLMKLTITERLPFLERE